MARCSSEISRIDAALAQPGLFDKDPGKAASLGKARALTAITLARAEEDWLEASAALESGSMRRLIYVAAGFLAPFCGFAGAGGGPGARSIATSRPPVNR